MSQRRLRFERDFFATAIQSGVAPLAVLKSLQQLQELVNVNVFVWQHPNPEILTVSGIIAPKGPQRKGSFW
jgi:hypothetical protein